MAVPYYDKYFTEEYKTDKESEIYFSPSKKYKFEVTEYKTNVNNIKRGIVYRVSDNKLVTDIKTNSSHITHSFFQKNNQEWLISTEGRFNKVFVNLDTLNIYNEHQIGYDVWCGIIPSPDNNTLAVISYCSYGGPLSTTFYDISKPAIERPILKINGLSGDDVQLYIGSVWEPKWNEEWNSDGTYTFKHFDEYDVNGCKWMYDIDRDEDELDDDSFEKLEHRSLQNIVFKRDHHNMIVTDYWISDDLLKRREKYL